MRHCLTVLQSRGVLHFISLYCKPCCLSWSWTSITSWLAEHHKHSLLDRKKYLGYPGFGCGKTWFNPLLVFINVRKWSPDLAKEDSLEYFSRSSFLRFPRWSTKIVGAIHICLQSVYCIFNVCIYLLYLLKTESNEVLQLWSMHAGVDGWTVTMSISKLNVVAGVLQTVVGV